MQELDRVLDAHDVLVAFFVDLVTGPTGSGKSTTLASMVDKDEPAGLLRHLLYGLGEPELLKARNLLRNSTKGRAKGAALEVHVDAEAGRARQGVGDVQLPVVLQALALLVGENIVDHLPRRIRRQHRILQGLHLAVNPDHGRQTHGDVQVARPRLYRVEQVVV